ncbi:MAG: hypothetical protein KGH69_03685 [Candidatus Micrarchaeota archaeon]|nr:hypothetical protein [Candidatus Micrarchaeota archaeon]
MAAIRINLRKQLVRLHMSRRHAKAAGLIKSFVAMHQKVDEDMVKLDKELNQRLSIRVSRNIEPIDVSVEKAGAVVNVKLVKPAQEQKADDKKDKQKSKDTQKEKESANQTVKPAKAPEPPKPNPLKNEPKDKKVQNKT